MIDTAEITVKSGNGGDGIVSFRREKYIPFGGPWGGDGGKGADIYFYVDENLNTLSAFKRQRKYEAPKGMPGMRNKKQGISGEDLTVKVPVGTVVRDSENRILHDLTQHGEKILIQKGGRGGLGNVHFKSSVNRTPRKATQGERTPIIELKLELKLIADAGIIGLPSSGKSTLLNSLAKTEVKTAEYHFTTLEPNVGVVRTSEIIGEGYDDIVLADIPGVIEGAAEGKGLGHDFLRHIERTKVLIHMLDGSTASLFSIDELVNNYKVIQSELKKWDEEIVKVDPSISKLSQKNQVVVVNKIDITEVKNMQSEISKRFKKEFNLELLSSKARKVVEQSETLLFISAATSEGTKELLSKVSEEISNYEKKSAETNEAASEELRNNPGAKKFDITTLPNKRIVFRNKKDLP